MASLLTTTLTLKRQTTTKDASGGAVLTPFAAQADYTDIPADVQPASSSTRLQYMQKQLFVTHSIFFDRNIGAGERDILTGDAGTFLVQGYRDGSAGRGRCWIADCEEQP